MLNYVKWPPWPLCWKTESRTTAWAQEGFYWSYCRGLDDLCVAGSTQAYQAMLALLHFRSAGFSYTAIFRKNRDLLRNVVSFQGKSHGPRVWMQGCKLQVSLQRRIEAAKCTWTPGLNPGEGAEEFFPTERFFGFGAASTSEVFWGFHYSPYSERADSGDASPHRSIKCSVSAAPVSFPVSQRASKRKNCCKGSASAPLVLCAGCIRGVCRLLVWFRSQALSPKTSG